MIIPFFQDIALDPDTGKVITNSLSTSWYATYQDRTNNGCDKKNLKESINKKNETTSFFSTFKG